jgi:hypothetical protein
MLNKHMAYRRDGTPYPDGTEGLIEWGKDMQDNVIKVVKQETLPNGYWVSTVWLGLNHNWGTGPPLIFETMVTNPFGDWEDYQKRYSTEAEALDGHTEAVRYFSQKP